MADSERVLCDTCARLIEYEPGDFVIQDACCCPRTERQKKRIKGWESPMYVCADYERKADR